MKRQPRKRPWWAKTGAPKSAPVEFYRRFGKIKPTVAHSIAEEVQRHAIDAYELVENVILRIGDRLGMGRATTYRYLRAGRWLQNQQGGLTK